MNKLQLERRLRRLEEETLKESGMGNNFLGEKLRVYIGNCIQGGDFSGFLDELVLKYDIEQDGLSYIMQQFKSLTSIALRGLQEDILTEVKTKLERQERLSLRFPKRTKR